jgi:glycine reductase complex component B subunit alpha and beta
MRDGRDGTGGWGVTNPKEVTLDPILEVATYRVRDVVAGDATRWEGGTLQVDLAALERIADALPGIRSVNAAIVRPGESTRIASVLDVVEPTVKPSDPQTTFSGNLGTLGVAGVGASNRLDGMAVVSTIGPAEQLDRVEGLIDMGGPGAPLSYWSRTCNLVLSFDADPSATLAEIDRSIRFATLTVARDLAATTMDRPPDESESLELGPADGELPSLCVVMQVASEGPGVDTLIYGAPVVGIMPVVLDPREILDGAIVSGAFDHASVRNPTYFYQRSLLLRRLIAGHGSRWWFKGVVVTLGYLNGGFEKQRAAVLAAKLASQIGAQGAVLTTFSSGNSHTDTMLTCRACEGLGIRTTVLIAESNGGLTDFVPEADCIVSVGNEDELVEGWHPDHTVGGRDPRVAPDHDAPVPLRDYLGANSQLGDMPIGVEES